MLQRFSYKNITYFVIRMFRQIATILLLCLFVFNIIGYRLIVSISMAKADTALQLSLDNKTYNQADLFLVKIPINLPYQNNWTSFERVDGEVNFEGETYRFVQRKVEKANDYFGKTNDVAIDNHTAKKSSSNHSAASKYQVEDFVNDNYQWQLSSFIASINYSIQHADSKGYNHLQQLIKPPQAYYI